jgi:hypothetical protein
MRLTTVTACGIIDMSSWPMRPAPFPTLSLLLLLLLRHHDAPFPPRFVLRAWQDEVVG